MTVFHIDFEVKSNCILYKVLSLSLQIDVISLYLLTLAQMTVSGLFVSRDYVNCIGFLL